MILIYVYHNLLICEDLILDQKRNKLCTPERNVNTFRIHSLMIIAS